MEDSYEKEKAYMSLPPKLQSRNDEENKNKPTIINIQRAFYSNKIADIENKINRLEDRNNKLFEEIEATNDLSATIDAEISDETANLRKLVFSQNNQVENLKIRINELKILRIKDSQAQDDRVELLNQKYKRKKVELVSQTKCLNAKINALEDFKKMQIALQEKLKGNNDLVIKREQHLKEVLESINQKFKFDKEMLKKEMYNHLLDLTTKFQTEINKQINIPSQRLMRENVILKKELLQIPKEVSVMKENEISFKDSVVKYRKCTAEQLLHIKRNIITIQVQAHVLKLLKKKFSNRKKCLSLINVPEDGKEGRCLMAIEHYQLVGHNINFHLSKLETLLHNERLKLGVAKYLQKKVSCNIKAVVEMLYNLKYIVMCMLQSLDRCTCKTEMKYTEMVLLFQNILVKGQSKLRCCIVNSVESIPREATCLREDLKEIPEETSIGVLTDSEEKELTSSRILGARKPSNGLDQEKKISSESNLFEEDLPEDISQDITLLDINLEDELSADDEAIEGESLSNITQE